MVRTSSGRVSAILDAMSDESIAEEMDGLVDFCRTTGCKHAFLDGFGDWKMMVRAVEKQVDLLTFGDMAVHGVYDDGNPGSRHD